MMPPDSAILSRTSQHFKPLWHYEHSEEVYRITRTGYHETNQEFLLIEDRTPLFNRLVIDESGRMEVSWYIA